MKSPIILTICFLCLTASCSVSRQAKVSEAPVIGISAGFSGTGNSLGQTYVNAVRKAGGVPVILPGVKTKEDADALIASIDGIIFSGGEDVAPAYYGESILNESVGINAPRDTSDFLLVQAARDRQIPIMGICRGEQLLNVAFGGTLWQDLPAQKGVEHRQKQPSTVATHKVILEKGSRIRELLADADTISVNTHHHQAVKDIAPGCKVTAWSEDGIVEAWEGPGVFCVQFHPEGLIWGGDDSFLPLFRTLVEMCR